MVIYIPKLVYLLFHFLNYLLNLVLYKKTLILRYVGVLLSALVVVLLFHGAFVNTKNVELNPVELHIADLPKEFDNFRIVHISDMHLGGWGSNHTYLQPAIPLINAQNADLIIFSGDMVNNYSQEMEGWAPLFQQLHANIGKYAVLGNHDYGDYSNWKSDAAKENNFAEILQHFQEFGFTLLRNEHVVIARDTAQIELVGVDNWGKPPFPKYGDLDKALSKTQNNLLKILVSHDPSHWKAEVVGRENIFLTLSGHTHAAQMAFSKGGNLYSPSALIYNEWAGIYQYQDQFLNVNRGLGFVGIPVRLGAARPEVTLITLKSK